MLFAPVYHASMKYAAPVRKEMGDAHYLQHPGPFWPIRRGPTSSCWGCTKIWWSPWPGCWSNLGSAPWWCMGTMAWTSHPPLYLHHRVRGGDGRINSFSWIRAKFGFETCRPEDLVGGGPEENAEIARRILAGEKGPKRDIVLLNSALCPYGRTISTRCGNASGMAADTLDSGRAREQMGTLCTR